MEPAERKRYYAALVYEGLNGPEAAKEKPFRGLSEGEVDSHYQAALNVLKGMSGATEDTVGNGAPNAFALPTVDPVTGERLQYTADKKFGDLGVAERAGLTGGGLTETGKFDTGSEGGSDTTLPKGSKPVVKK